VVPELTWAYDYGLDVDAPQLWQPRVFKAHLSPAYAVRCHPGARFVFVVREPKDVLVSVWKFFHPKARELMSGTDFHDVDEFAASSYWREFHWLFNGHIWMYIRQAWEARRDPSVLLLFYEDLKDEPETQVRRLAQHMGVEVDTRLMDTVLELSSHAWMLENASMFDEHWITAQQRALGRLGPAGAATACDKVTPNGTYGAHRCALTSVSSSAMDELWARRVGVATGYDSYDAMLAAFRAEQLYRGVSAL